MHDNRHIDLISILLKIIKLISKSNLSIDSRGSEPHRTLYPVPLPPPEERKESRLIIKRKYKQVVQGPIMRSFKAYLFHTYCSIYGILGTNYDIFIFLSKAIFERELRYKLCNI